MNREIRIKELLIDNMTVDHWVGWDIMLESVNTALQSEAYKTTDELKLKKIMTILRSEGSVISSKQGLFLTEQEGK